jgi:membrane-associated protein
MAWLISFFLHLDTHLGAFIQQYGSWTYPLLFLIIFCETGLVVTPFLPGDSLLFAAGAFAALGSLDLLTLLALLTIAAVLGDSLNYAIGRRAGERLLAHPWFSRRINPAHIERARTFYAKHGSKTIVLARFVPIVRTFAPFVAGISRMPYATFFTYNIVGGIIWIFLFTLGGFFFGNIPAVKERFSLVILLIIAISLIPVAVEYIRAKKTAYKESRR